MPLERELEQTPASATATGSWFGRRVWLDRLLVMAWLAATVAFVAAAGREVTFHAGAVTWNSMWESAPLEVAMNAARGRSIYGDWHEGPVHLAIYGPLYYKTLGLLGAAIGADRLQMIALGRWTGIVFLALGLVGAAWFVWSQNGSWWAALIGMACAGLLSPTAIRFVASARPDAMAAALSVLGLTVALSRWRAGVVVGAVLLAGAWLTKVTAVAAPLTAVFALAAFPRRSGGRARGRWRRFGVFCSLFLLVSGAAVASLMITTDGWFRRHLAVASAAPMSPKYTWFMLTRRPAEPQIRYLFVFPALAVLTAALVRWQWRDANFSGGRASRPPSATYDHVAENLVAEDMAGKAGGRPLCIAAVFFILSAGIALATAMRQGSDRNYLIEPTLAAGMVMGAWAARVAGVCGRREWLVTRVAAALTLFSPMLLGLPDRFAASGDVDRILREVMSPYQDEAFAWARTLPHPLLCLDSWLAYRAGANNGLNDPIAYASYCVAGGGDPVVQRVRQRRYGCIVTLAPADGSDYQLYGDITTLWPGLREAIARNYSLQGRHGRWYAYVPRADK